MEKAGRKLYGFASGLVGNRVLDLYLKYIGIKTLTTATLMPIALIVGKDAFEKVIKSAKQKGGFKKLPVLDDPLVGNYLKLAGLSTVNVTMNTLVPLGTLMLVYHLFTKKETQTGGNLTKYVKRVYGNRVLDIFLKYQGIKMLTSTTLVPFALILGKDALENVLKNPGNQKGGFVPDDLPVLDDPLLGNYLKLAGLSAFNLTPHTLVPLGILAVLHDTYLKK
jgi:hypothetical protein